MTTISKRANGTGSRTGILAHQPVAREARNDPPADQRDQQHHDRDADPDADICGPGKMSFDMKGDVAHQQEDDDADHRQIAPIAARRDLAGCSGGDQRQEAHIDQHRCEPAGVG
jgi:hypothetical protein